jgi:hypothetical protein
MTYLITYNLVLLFASFGIWFSCAVNQIDTESKRWRCIMFFIAAVQWGLYAFAAWWVI